MLKKFAREKAICGVRASSTDTWLAVSVSNERKEIDMSFQDIMIELRDEFFGTPNFLQIK